MNSTFSTGARIFPCPNCSEMIYSDAPTCRFCGTPVDRQSAEAASDVQKQVNNAVNLAKWIRNTAGAMWVLLGLGLIFGVAFLGAIVCMFVIPWSLIYWQVKFGRVKTADADFTKTKRDRIIALALWLPASAIELLFILARVAL